MKRNTIKHILGLTTLFLFIMQTEEVQASGYGEPMYTPPMYQNGYNYSQSGSQISYVTLNRGESASVQMYGEIQRLLSNDNWRTVQSSVFNNVVTLRAINAGTSLVTICSQAGCMNIYVNVVGNYNTQYYHPYAHHDDNYYDSYDYDYDNEDLLDISSIYIDKGDRERIDINIDRRDEDDLYISRNTNSRIASADIDDDELVIRGLREGTTRITICDDNQCSTLRVEVED